MRFGEKLRKLRCEYGMTQEELAQRLFVSRSAVSKWETDAGYPNIESLKQLSHLFGMSIDELISDEDIEHKKGLEAKRNRVFYICAVACVAMAAVFAALVYATGKKIFTFLSIAAVIGYVCFALWYKAQLRDRPFGKELLKYVISRVLIAAILITVILTTILS